MIEKKIQKCLIEFKGRFSRAVQSSNGFGFACTLLERSLENANIVGGTPKEIVDDFIDITIKTAPCNSVRENEPQF